MPPLDRARRRAVLAAWKILPFAVTAAPILLSAPADMPPPFAAALSAAAPAAAAYYILSHPSRLNVFAAAGLGLLQDALYFQPLGIGMLAWAGFHAALSKGRKRLPPEGFLLHWMLAAFGLAAMTALEFLAAALFRVPVRRDSLATMWVLSVLLYPALHELLLRLDRACWRRWWPVLKRL